ncbi:4-hydroxy-tetrahydrodipicolinate reductase [Candidatus Epulonipiscium fishelsonii]|uniref:4-hydroxy-tetrahydrodipicolinate reductase n=1 Tax=Candidatus Epulonipiscium fishelsonii TaxID=77094 RepID=A0ACC8XDA2_9FIRM|nr:4-hydroxy-tetrahydrodipicolinate reductase [Epulopiscium sp. SCG-B05WGA-EpuloA1]ONI40898.1 4-hydroxy-tetrahydrodipicolinate reductase [Epulopiscium sp. SCG-B11WGA-EpuloA1]
MIKILLHGCNGKLGQVIVNLVRQHEDFEIIAGIDTNTSISYNFPIFTNIYHCHIFADVIIDFSTAKAIPNLIQYSTQRHTPLVLCTTGLSQEYIELIHNASKSIPIFYSANMSIGVNLIISLAKRATEVLSDSGFDIEIIEKHHNKKIDAPSGTALAIAEGIQSSLEEKYSLTYDRSKENNPRPKNEIGIHAVRGGTIVGEHEIIFAGMDEIITISHSATSREVFGVGALKASKFLVDKPAGLYDMNDLLEFPASL